MIPTRYYLTVSAGPGQPHVAAYLALYGEEPEPLAVVTEEWSAFGFTWLDLATWIAHVWKVNGGGIVMRAASPFLDLT